MDGYYTNTTPSSIITNAPCHRIMQHYKKCLISKLSYGSFSLNFPLNIFLLGTTLVPQGNVEQWLNYLKS